MFQGFPASTEQFFMDLRFHNDPSFFHQEHDRYVRDVQTPFYEFGSEMAEELLKLDDEMEFRPHKLLSRIHRDTRFSNDKTPYRDHLWLYFKRRSEDRYQSVGFWFEYGPERLSWGLATWGENRPLMDRFRRELEADPYRYLGIISKCQLQERGLVLTSSQFKRLSIPPKLPMALIPWYLTRDFSLSQRAPDLREAASRRIFTHVRNDFEAMGPIYLMLRGMQDELAAEEKKLSEGTDKRV
ncbi:MAG: DUF2461 domain-containing protein [Clostridia bacterium]|nr:DUF2461 domain-containing protein [Clostridia bacterium]